MNEDDEEDKQGEVTDVQPINDMDWIIKPQTKTGHPVGGLAISNIVFCQDRQKMQRQKFKAVLSICGDKLELPVSVQHLWIVFEDHPKEDISMFFSSTFSFIEKHIQHGNVLVHCRAGISRSCSIVIAYLIKKHKLPYQQAFEIVRSNRPVAFPNKGFTKQLKRFANSINPNQQSKNTRSLSELKSASKLLGELKGLHDILRIKDEGCSKLIHMINRERGL